MTKKLLVYISIIELVLGRMNPLCAQEENVESISLSVREVTRGTWAGGPFILRVVLNNVHEREKAKIDYRYPQSLRIVIVGNERFRIGHDFHHCPWGRRQVVIDPKGSYEEYLVHWAGIFSLENEDENVAVHKGTGEHKIYVALRSEQGAVLESNVITIRVDERPSGKDLWQLFETPDAKQYSPLAVKFLAVFFGPSTLKPMEGFPQNIVRILEGFHSNLEQEMYLVRNFLVKCYYSKLDEECKDYQKWGRQVRDNEWFKKLMGMKTAIEYEYIPIMARERRFLMARAMGFTKDYDAAIADLRTLIDSGVRDYVTEEAEKSIRDLVEWKDGKTPPPPPKPPPPPPYSKPSDLDGALIGRSAVDDVKEVEALLDKGASINGRDEWGQTPLLAASFGHCKEAAMLLIRRGADVNAANKDGTAALHVWAATGEMPVVELLLANGADVNAFSTTFGTPLDSALQRRRPNWQEVAEILRKHGAKLGKELK
ncbi:MAG: ankyrin repeat domain-containing protein [Planctomycetota bacterium]